MKFIATNRFWTWRGGPAPSFSGAALRVFGRVFYVNWQWPGFGIRCGVIR